MSDYSKTDLKELIRGLENNEILLPDFQRGFVWRDEEQQKKLVASVLTKMPMGSILLLASKSDEYQSKFIGGKNPIVVKPTREVNYLLDGQQRITVLSNVFSSVIFDTNKIGDLVAPAALKRRFFLKIPKWSNASKESDLFGVGKLAFPYEDPDTDIPKFLSGDIFPSIEFFQFLAGDNQPYVPGKNLDVEIDDFCITYQNGYLIPLYLLVPTGSEHNRSVIKNRFDKIINGIASKISEEIESYYVLLNDDKKKKAFINKIVAVSDDADAINKGTYLLSDALQSQRNSWANAMSNYLLSCIKNMDLARIQVSSKDRARAIDIYENLNRGGVSLNTFDLVMARVAKVNSENFYQRIISEIMRIKYYPKDVLPSAIENELGKKLDNNSHNATTSMNCFNETKNEISSKYIEVFLDVLGLYITNKKFDPAKYSISNFKRDQILRLEPKDIDSSCNDVIIAIDRALFFFQTRCGIRSISEINYALMIVLVAIIFFRDELFLNEKIHDLLEAWYWSAVFSGEYDRDQNTTMVANLSSLMKTISTTKDCSWMQGMKDNILNAKNFSDKDLLLLDKVKTEDRYPKKIIQGFLCQYLLAKTYQDMFEDKRISVFCPDADSLEMHHIVPLGSTTSYGQSTADLRTKDDNICNSPLNFVFITKEANKTISSKSLEEYSKKILVAAKSSLHIGSYDDSLYTDNNGKTRAFLEKRFDDLKGDICNKVKVLLGYWE